MEKGNSGAQRKWRKKMWENREDRPTRSSGILFFHWHSQTVCCNGSLIGSDIVHSL